MKRRIVSQADLCRRLGVDERTLETWKKWKLLRPSGMTDDRLPVYTEEAVVRGERIRKLFELGYGMREIQKIIRKVGLPRLAGAEGVGGGNSRFLTVGALAEKVGVSPRTIKHWEEMGIIEPDMRSEGGFRFYEDVYVYLCKLIRDLQLFGYSLQSIQMIAGLFRDFLAIQKSPDQAPAAESSAKLDTMLREIDRLSEIMDLLRSGIGRWEELLKKKRKEVAALRQLVQKRLAASGRGKENG